MKEVEKLEIGKEYYLDHSMLQTGFFVKRDLDSFWFIRGDGDEYDLSSNGLIGFHGKKYENRFRYKPIENPVINS